MPDQEKARNIWQRHLSWGLIFGSTAGVVESIWVHLYGYNISWPLIAGIIGFDLIVLSLLFLLAAAVAVLAGEWGRKRSLPLALGLYTFWSLGLFIISYLKPYRRLSHPLAVPLYLALLLITILVVVLYTRLESRWPVRRNVLSVAFLAVGLELGIAIFSAMMTRSRAWSDPWESQAWSSLGLSLVAACAGWFFLPGVRGPHQGKERSSLAGAGLFVITALAAVIVVLAPIGIWNRWASRPIEDELVADAPRSSMMPNVILMVLDTVRSDRLTIYGAQRDTSPNLERFARSSIIYDRVITPSSFSLPSHATLFTGMYPVQHQCNVIYRPDASNPWEKVSIPLALSGEQETIAERLGRAGYLCGGITANSFYVTRKFGFEQGFHYFDDRHGERLWFMPRLARGGRFLARFVGGLRALEDASRDAEVIVDQSVEWLDKVPDDRPYFLFLNFMEAHEPYAPPDSHWGIYSSDDDTDWAPLENEGFSEDEIRFFNRQRDRYDEEITYLDQELGRLFNYLESRTDWARTVVIITSDHGESLGERRLKGHGRSLYSPELWVPLILRYPGGPSGIRDGRLVELTDIVPTIQRLCGIEPDPTMPGESLLDEAEDDFAVCVLKGHMAADENDVHWGPWAVYTAGKKLLTTVEGSSQLFDYEASMNDGEDIAALFPQISDRLTSELDQWIAENRSDQSAMDSEVIDEETLELLKAVGYLE